MECHRPRALSYTGPPPKVFLLSCGVSDPQYLENPKTRHQVPEGILDHSSYPPDPIVEDHLLQVHTVAGVGPH